MGRSGEVSPPDAHVSCAVSFLFRGNEINHPVPHPDSLSALALAEPILSLVNNCPALILFGSLGRLSAADLFKPFSGLRTSTWWGGGPQAAWLRASGCTVKPDVGRDGYVSLKKTVRVALAAHLENPGGGPGESAQMKQLREE